ncbi:MAG: guanylate kinase [Candidatus Kapaibacterium sp.]|nr:guanylate kinase [Bacteroidota bacterium]
MAGRKRLIVLSAPSGAGKTTVARHLLRVLTNARFSVSATTRPMRPREVDGKDYFFLSKDEFEKRIQEQDLIEYEQIFGNYYGTLRSEVQRALDSDEIMIFDVDVKGAISLQKAFPDDTFLLFIAPPSKEELEHRLRSRSTESEEQLRMRLERVEMELEQQELFDAVIINDVLPETLAQSERLVKRQLEDKKNA